MLYREYGKTGKKVSLLGYGGMRFKPGDYEGGDYGRCADLLLRARELGVNYFDTAPRYCGDKSEGIYGQAFRQMKKGFYVSTKNSVNILGDKTPEEFRRRLETSLSRLGVERINFFHIWCILDYDAFLLNTKPGSFLDAARKAQEEGLIEHICFSTHAGGPDIRKMLEQRLFDGILLGYNALNFAYREEGLAAAGEAGVGVSVMNPLGGGLIPENPGYFSFLSKDGESPTAAALRFVARHPQVSVVLSGMSSLEEVEANAAALSSLEPFSPGEREAMTARARESLNSVCTGCSYCDNCPVGVAVPKYMDAYNQYILTGDKNAMRQRLRAHWKIPADDAAACVSCGSCEAACTQKLPIIDRLREISELAKG